MEYIDELPAFTNPDSLNPPLDKDIGEFLRRIMGSARQCFEEDHIAHPIFLTLKGMKVVPTVIRDLNPDNKMDLFEWMHRQVPNHDCCVFVNEVWMAKGMKSEKSNFLLAPSQRVDREESVMINLWTPNRRMTLIAKITRKPDHLGPWLLMDDSANTDPKACHAAGPMIGVPYPKEFEDEHSS